MRRPAIAVLAVVLLLSVQVLGIVCPAATVAHTRCPLAAVMHCAGERCGSQSVRATHTPDQTSLFEATEPVRKLRLASLVTVTTVFAVVERPLELHRAASVADEAPVVSPGGFAPIPLRI